MRAENLCKLIRASKQSKNFVAEIGLKKIEHKKVLSNLPVSYLRTFSNNEANSDRFRGGTTARKEETKTDEDPAELARKYRLKNEKQNPSALSKNHTPSDISLSSLSSDINKQRLTLQNKLDSQKLMSKLPISSNILNKIRDKRDNKTLDHLKLGDNLNIVDSTKLFSLAMGGTKYIGNQLKNSQTSSQSSVSRKDNEVSHTLLNMQPTPSGMTNPMKYHLTTTFYTPSSQKLEEHKVPSVAVSNVSSNYSAPSTKKLDLSNPTSQLIAKITSKRAQQQQQQSQLDKTPRVKPLGSVSAYSKDAQSSEIKDSKEPKTATKNPYEIKIPRSIQNRLSNLSSK